MYNRVYKKAKHPVKTKQVQIPSLFKARI